MRSLYVLALLGATVTLVWGQKDPNWTEGRSTIVHLFEWKFSDIALECERYLGPQGYAGVQVSPITEHMNRNVWWDRYSLVSYKIISRSGNEDEFADMVRRCNDVGVRIYIDVVLRNMGGGSDPGIGGSIADPASKYYPAVPYYPQDFLPLCPLNNYPPEYRDCSLFGLNTLAQSTSWVRYKQIELLDKLVDYGVAGFRIEAAQYMWPANLAYIYSQVKSLSTSHGFPAGSRPFFFQDIIDTVGTDQVHNEYTGIGRVTELRYGLELSGCFGGNNALKWLKNFGTEWRLMNGEDALAFIDNHDNQRQAGGLGSILTFKRPKQYKMAVAFMQAWPYGVTRVISSYAFSDSDAGPPVDADGNVLDVAINSDLSCANGWVCEHRWRQITNMLLFKKVTEGTDVSNWWDNGNNQIAFCRGDAGFITFNLENYDLNETLQTCLPEGTYCDLISGTKSEGRCTGKYINVTSDGTATVQILSEEEDGVLAVTRESKL